MMDDLRYPIGEFKSQGPATEELRCAWIADVAALPEQLREAVAGLSEQQLNTLYRPGGWTVRQVVHHFPDSHLNAYVRFRLALTEDQPTIKPYDEAKWAELVDARTAPAALSLQLVDALHQRWVLLLRSMAPADYSRTLKHPERGLLSLDEMLAIYAWHCRHHLAHITGLRRRLRW